MVINNFKVYQNGIWTIESADVFWNEHQERVYYAIPSELQDAICQTNADAFIVGFIQLAAKYNEDIVVNGRPISKELSTNIETILIPTFNKMGCGTIPIRIEAEYYENSFPKRNGATGISLGVDSFYSILTNTPQNVKYVLNVLDCNDFDDLLQDIHAYDTKSDRKKAVADLLKCKYVPVLTNMNAILSLDYNYGQTHSFIHLSIALMLMNQIDVYYYSTGYADNDFRLDLSDSSHYDVLISQVVTYDNFKMVTSGGDVTRVQKTGYLSKFTVTQEYLDVCLKNRHDTQKGIVNCSVCAKCRRTMVTLDVLGKLDGFSKVFDVDYFQNHKPWYIGEILYAIIIMKDLFAIEIYREMKKRQYKIPASAWWYFLKRGITNQANKLKKLVK